MGARSWPSVLVLSSLLPLLGAGRVALAEEPSAETFEQAHALYEEGATAYRAGRFAEAEINFRRVHNLLHAPSVLFDLALAQERQQKWGEAAANFEVFLRDSTHPARRDQVEQRVGVLRELHRRPRPPQASGTAPPPLAPPADEWELDSGETAPPAAAVDGDLPPPALAPSPPAPPAPSVAPAPAPAPVAPPAATQSDPEKRRPSRWVVWAVVGAVAVAAVAVGVGLGLGLKREPAPAAPTDFDFSFGALGAGGAAAGLSLPALVRF